MPLKTSLLTFCVTAVTFFPNLTKAQARSNTKKMAGNASVFEIAQDANMIPLSAGDAQKVLDDPFSRWTKSGEIVAGIRRYADFSVVYRITQDGYFAIGITAGPDTTAEANTFFLYKFKEISEPYPQVGRCFSFKIDGADKFVVFEATPVKDHLVLMAYLVDAPAKNQKIGSIRAASPISNFCIARAFTDSPRVEEFFGAAGVPYYSFWGMKALLPTAPLP